MNRDDMHITINVSPGGQANIASENGTIQAICSSPAPAWCLTRPPVKNCFFVGRKREKAETKQRLSVYHKLLLHGIGGVGKTALAKAVYFDLQKQYAHVAWVDFEDNLKDSLLRCVLFFDYQLPVTASEQERYHKLIHFFTNAKGNILLVIDNFKAGITEDLSELMRLPCDILVTSRGEMDGISCFPVDRPEEDECKELFLGKIYQLSELTPPEEEITKLVSILPPFSRIAKNDLQSWLSSKDPYALASLESRGWIQQESTSIFMHEVVCECVYRYHEIKFTDCQRMLDNLERRMNYEQDGNLLLRIRYAEYTLHIIRLKKGEDIAFCQHLAVKDAALVFKEIGKYAYSKELLDTIIPHCGEDKPGGNLLLAELYNNYRFSP